MLAPVKPDRTHLSQLAKPFPDALVYDLISFICIILTCLMLISYIPVISLALRDLVYNK